METSLPSFRKPPLVETAVAIQFNAIPNLKNVNLAIFWQAMRADFPNVSDAQPLPEQIEVFGEQALRPRLMPSFQVAPATAAARLEMASSDNCTVTQVQNGRIILNWRKGDNADYPRWKELLPKFRAAVKTFNEALATENLGPILPNQWEVVYVNHLVRGRDWDSPKDWPALLPGLVAKRNGLSVGTMESFSCRTQSLMPDNSGRVYVELLHGFNSLDSAASEILALQIAARGGVQEGNMQQAYNGLELGHQAVVRAFCDLTGNEAQSKWERKT